MFKSIAALGFAFVMTLGLALSPAMAEEKTEEPQAPAVEAAPPAEEATQEAPAQEGAEAEEAKDASAHE